MGEVGDVPSGKVVRGKAGHCVADVADVAGASDVVGFCAGTGAATADANV